MERTNMAFVVGTLSCSVCIQRAQGSRRLIKGHPLLLGHGVPVEQSKRFWGPREEHLCRAPERDDATNTFSPVHAITEML